MSVHFDSIPAVWDAGYKTEKCPATGSSIDKRPSWAIYAPNGKLLGYAHGALEVCRLASRHANGWGSE
jgi:hypothetical protein